MRDWAKIGVNVSKLLVSLNRNFLHLLSHHDARKYWYARNLDNFEKKKKGNLLFSKIFVLCRKGCVLLSNILFL